jgi:hypothetical protein
MQDTPPNGSHELDALWVVEARAKVTFPFMPLHYADPHKKQSRRYQALESFGRSRPGQWYGRHVGPHI